MRLFLAIELPESWRRAAVEAATTLAAKHGGSLRTVRAELMHLTVRFLGEVDDDRVEPLQAELRAAIPPLDLRLELGAGGTFGKPARTGAVWLGIGGDLDGLRALAARVEEAIAAAGLPAEERELRPHLTFARVRRRAGLAERRAVARAARELTAPEVEPFVARELALIRSRPGGEGPRYERLAIFGGDAGSLG